jgi:superfamily II DNA/RNA helicase
MTYDDYVHRIGRTGRAASASAPPAEWDSVAPPPPVGRAALSANIRAKRKVAALLGGGPKA